MPEKICPTCGQVCPELETQPLETEDIEKGKKKGRFYGDPVVDIE